MLDDQQIKIIMLDEEYENDKNKDEASTSKQGHLTNQDLTQTSDQMNNLINECEYNSADDIRQTMKRVLSSKVVPFKSAVSNENTNSMKYVKSNASGSKRKRRKEPSYSSASKKVKGDNSVASLYNGKLSNVVPFGRYYASASSDSDS